MTFPTNFRTNVASFFGHLALTSSANYVVLAIAARQLDAKDIAHFVTLAAWINGASLAILIPVEQIAPRWVQDGHSTRTIALKAASLGGAAALTAFILNSIFSNQSMSFPDAIYAVGALAFNITRSTLVGSGKLKQLSIYSFAYFLCILVGLGVIFSANLWTIQNLEITVGLAGVVASAPHLSRALSGNSPGNLTAPKDFHLVFSGMGNNLAGMLFLHGPLLFAAFRNAPPTEIVLYVALSNLARLLLYPLQAFVPALTGRIYSMRNQGQYSMLLRMQWQTTSLLLLGVPLLTGFFALSASTLASLTLGSTYGVSSAFAALIAFTEVVGLLSAIPLLMSVAFGHSRLLLGSSGAGLLLFLTVSFLPGDPTALMIFCRLAPLSLISVVVNSSMLQTLRRHARGAPY